MEYNFRVIIILIGNNLPLIRLWFRLMAVRRWSRVEDEMEQRSMKEGDGVMMIIK